MRLLHTSDWHLGHTLHDADRSFEHTAFLAWLLDQAEARDVDAIIITGDIFDSASPSATAQVLWYDFLAQTRARLASVSVVVIGGNHDSPARLDAPGRLLSSMDIHIVGGLPRTDGNLDLDRLVVPLRGRSGEVEALVAAVPFLRPADLRRDVDGPTGDPMIEGVREVYREVVDNARARLQGDQALIATGHCYMVATSLSHLSERRILGGNQHALPATVFADDIDYVALGHLHKAQRLGKRETMRYAGSPIPLAMNEANYRHQICIVDTVRGHTEVETVAIPRTVALMRIPKRGSMVLEEVLEEVAALPSKDDASPRPFLEIEVLLDKPQPRLRQLIEDAVADKHPRLVRLGVAYAGTGQPLAEAKPADDLKDVAPEDVFIERYRKDHDGEPPEELMETFLEILDLALTDDESGSLEGAA